jgi:hypothetical protein
LEWLDLLQWLPGAGKVPIVSQFGKVRLSPFSDEVACLPRQLAVDYFARFNCNFSFMLGIDCVKMWRCMVAVIEVDGNSVKLANPGHTIVPYPVSIIRQAFRHFQMATLRRGTLTRPCDG